ncbi:efflux RND transporter periplasmic adaptor subunit [Marinobacterium jannaschii]|uniref:efflux RND transporter periplasmic adaptor subunit n=1 Tax=Marinobacterium jannaschii TaxID=64970 RepID=UPI0012EC786B|nr:efflux RND transporter periplasmic adaptor subunit [Marinobacterium jannaschii]
MKKILSTLTILLIGIAAGHLISTQLLPKYLPQFAVTGSGESQDGTADANEPLYWVAPMDANYRRDKPGLSPMGMELVPVYAEDLNGDSPGTVKISPEVVNNLGVRSAEVGFGPLTRRVDTVGYVGFDEDQLQHIHSRLPGWIRKLHVRSNGSYVEKGAPLYELYSPQLVNAQEEYLTALRSRNQLLQRSARDKLRALDVSVSQIRTLARRGRAQEAVTVYAPRAGYVNELAVRNGMFVKPEMSMMTLGPLDQVWVTAELFERQAGAVRVGNPVQMQLDYAPGRVWQGQVDYIYPTLDAKNRTQRVRLRFANEDGRLKPNMFARVTIAGTDTASELHIPAEALIRTGNQNRVVLALGEGRFKSIAVMPGERVADQVLILDGLELGDRVVTSAQFLLDSESAVNSDLKRISSDEVVFPTAWVEAEIIQIDPDNQLLRFRHGEVTRWGMPQMVMIAPIAESLQQTLDIYQLTPGLKVLMQLDGSETMVRIVQLRIPDQAGPRGSGSGGAK